MEEKQEVCTWNLLMRREPPPTEPPGAQRSYEEKGALVGTITLSNEPKSICNSNKP
jgi:hypothetical protein